MTEKYSTIDLDKNVPFPMDAASYSSGFRARLVDPPAEDPGRRVIGEQLAHSFGG
jgi:hypothetical protein